jgi:hypothetical protein
MDHEQIVDLLGKQPVYSKINSNSFTLKRENYEGISLLKISLPSGEVLVKKINY